ncbi:MAG: hypothetical protein M3O36_14500 [Myxococcota bacterium]|nr:hypothetical protein [Myxococcota bacterium]
MTRGEMLALATAFVLHAGCTKPFAKEVPDAGAPPAISVATAAQAARGSWDATPPRATMTATRSTRALAWRGTYSSQPATVYVPPDWKNVHWKVAESRDGVGQGSMALALDERTGRVTGTLEGPLGPARIEGLAGDDTLTATIVRKEREDQGFTGTLAGAFTAERAEGVIKAALWDASALRAATFTLSSDPSR